MSKYRLKLKALQLDLLNVNCVKQCRSLSTLVLVSSFLDGVYKSLFNEYILYIVKWNNTTNFFLTNF